MSSVDNKRFRPSIGRILIYHQRPEEPQAHGPDSPCIITDVVDDDTVHVTVFFCGLMPAPKMNCKFSEGRVSWPKLS